MLPPDQTPRQRISESITSFEKVLSARELAQLVGIPVFERQVEDHLTHILKTVGRDKTVSNF